MSLQRYGNNYIFIPMPPHGLGHTSVAKTDHESTILVQFTLYKVLSTYCNVFIVLINTARACVPKNLPDVEAIFDSASNQGSVLEIIVYFFCSSRKLSWELSSCNAVGSSWSSCQKLLLIFSTGYVCFSTRSSKTCDSVALETKISVKKGGLKNESF